MSDHMWQYYGYINPEPVECKHEPVNNGFKRTECKVCKVAMEFTANMQWVAVANSDSKDKDNTPVGLAAWLPEDYRSFVIKGVLGGEQDHD